MNVGTRARGWSASIASRVLEDLRRLDASTVPQVRAVRQQYSKALASEPPGVVLQIVDTLLAENSWPARLVAFELLAEHDGAMRRLRGTTVEAMAEGLSDWGSIDLFGVTIAGPSWRNGTISDARVRRWAGSPDRWRRRLALVATVALNSKARGGSGDTARTLAICDMLADDRDDMVVKALSWALRELSKRDPAAVARFVRARETRLASRVRREVRTKLETGLKTPRRSLVALILCLFAPALVLGSPQEKTLRVWSARALATVLAEVGSEFERTSGYTVDVVSDLPAGFEPSRTGSGARSPTSCRSSSHKARSSSASSSSRRF